MSIDKELLNAIENYLNGTENEEERTLVNGWYHSFSDELVELPADLGFSKQDLDDRLWKRISLSTGTEMSSQQEKRRSFAIYKYAAAAILLIGIGITMVFIQHQRQQHPTQVAAIPDLNPGGNKAILILSNGKKLVLNNIAKGQVVKINGITVTKSTEGSITYKADSPSPQSDVAEIRYNTVQTPRGGEWNVILADGTKVWLNAASSLTFPNKFTTNERKVTLTGEAYFEVTHNAAAPFRVVTGRQTVEVVGTHFNINSYSDEPTITTTLLEGAVTVSKESNYVLLHPGEQSLNNPSLHTITVKSVRDLNEVMAWKNGEFDFNSTDLKTIMRQVSRWYDVDVEYASAIPNYQLSGTIKRNIKASNVLKILEYTGLNFKIEGRKIIVK